MTNTMRQIKNLAKLELCNLYGINVFRFTKQQGKKRKYACLFVLWCLLLAMMAFYLGNLSYGLIVLGLEEVVPAYLLMISSTMIFVFGMLKAGSMIFRREGYDVLCALPLPKGVIAVARLFRMYVENGLLTLAVLLPGIAVYAWNARKGVGAAFYVIIVLDIFAAPLIPMSAAVLVGALVTGISSRMRHKSLAASGLSVLMVFAILYGTSRMAALEGNLDAEMLRDLSAMVTGMLEKVYPPAVWLGIAAVRGDLWLICVRGCFCGSIGRRCPLLCEYLRASFWQLCDAPLPAWRAESRLCGSSAYKAGVSAVFFVQCVCDKYSDRAGDGVHLCRYGICYGSGRGRTASACWLKYGNAHSFCAGGCFLHDDDYGSFGLDGRKKLVAGQKPAAVSQAGSGCENRNEPAADPSVLCRV